MRSVISIGASSSESSAWYLRAYRRVFRGWYRGRADRAGGRGVGGGWGAARGKGLLPRRPLDRYTAITRRRIDPTTRRLTVRRIPRWNNPLFPPPPRTPFRFEEEKKPGHGEGPRRRRELLYPRLYIYVRGNNNRRWRRVCVCLWIYTGEGVVNLGNIYVLYCAKVSSSIFQTMYNLILLLNVLEGEKKEGRIVKPCMHESLKF